jgi:hypothetical protein
MRAATAVGATAILILVAEVWACAAGAEDAIQPGKWEISIVEPGITELRPGMHLDPGQSIGPEGKTSVTTKCASMTNPPFPPKPPPEGTNSPCKMEKSDLNGDTATWTIQCRRSSERASNTVEGTVHYHGDTLDGTSTLRITSPSGYTLAVITVNITGRYVGPCDPK